MSADLEKAIESLYSEMESLNQRISQVKNNINSLSALMNKPQPFTDAELSVGAGTFNIRPDQFFGMGVATAAKMYLKMRGYSATAQEIYDSLKTGGFEFPKEWGAKFQLRNLTISLSKNKYDFVYVKSSNSYGLWEFYPEKVKDRKKPNLQIRDDLKNNPDAGTTNDLIENEHEQK